MGALVRKVGQEMRLISLAARAFANADGLSVSIPRATGGGACPERRCGRTTFRQIGRNPRNEIVSAIRPRHVLLSRDCIPLPIAAHDVAADPLTVCQKPAVR